jgi:hypothetical protein
MFDVQLKDDMALYPGLFWTEWACLSTVKKMSRGMHLNAVMTPFYAHQNYDFTWIALWKPNTVISYFINELVMLAIEQAFKWCPLDPDSDLKWTIFGLREQ